MMDRLPSLALPGLSLSSHSLSQQASLNNHHHHSGHSSLNSLGLHTQSALHNSASTSVAAAAAAAASLYTTAQSGHHHIMNNSNNTRWAAINLNTPSIDIFIKMRATHANPCPVSFVVLLTRRRRSDRQRSSTSNGRWMRSWSGLGCSAARSPRTTQRCTTRRSLSGSVSYWYCKELVVNNNNNYGEEECNQLILDKILFSTSIPR